MTRFVSPWGFGRTREMPRTVVIGGGLAGISAALALADDDSSNEVVIIEARKHLGGRVSSVKDPETGIELDNCQHACFRVYGRFLQLLARSQAHDSIKLQSRTSLPFMNIPEGRIAALRDGRLKPPNHMLGSMLGFPFLNLKDKVPMRKVIKELASMDEEQILALDSIDFKSWLEERGQTKKAIDRFWGFFVLAALNTRIEEASTKLSAFLFKKGLFSDSHSFDVGAFTSDLSDSIHPQFEKAMLEAGIEVRTSESANSLVWDGVCKGVNTNKGTIECDSVIIALPHHLTARLLNDSNAPEDVKEIAKIAKGLQYRSLIGIHAIHPQPVLPEDFTFAVCLEQNVIQMLFNRNAELDKENCPDSDSQWISVPVSAADEFLNWDDDKFRQEYVNVVKNTYPESWCEPTTFKVIKSKKATFAATVGSNKNRPKQDAIAESGIYLAGAWTDTDWPSTMEGAVRSGLLAASKLMTKDWNADDNWKGWPPPPARNDPEWRAW